MGRPVRLSVEPWFALTGPYEATQPVSEQERERLIEQANKDIKVLIREILSQKEPLKTYDSEGQEVAAPEERPSDWVKVSPGTPETGAGRGAVGEEPEAGTPETVPEKTAAPKHPTVKEILERLKERSELGLEKEPETSGAAMLEGEKVSVVTAQPSPPAKTRPKIKGKGVVKPKLKRLRRTRVRKKRGAIRKQPEVITVREPGVYDIQLKKLLQGFPIIINCDGTYLVHLPSVFDSINRERRKGERT